MPLNPFSLSLVLKSSHGIYNSCYHEVDVISEYSRTVRSEASLNQPGTVLANVAWDKQRRGRYKSAVQ